jgi:hypothetical protein
MTPPSAIAPLPWSSWLLVAPVVGDDAFVQGAHIEQLVQRVYRFEIEMTVKDAFGPTQPGQNRSPQPLLAAG